MNLTIDTASVVAGGGRNNSKSNGRLQPPQLPKFPLSSPITDEIEHWPSSGESHEGNVPKLVGSSPGRGSSGLNPSSDSPLSKSEFEKVLYANLQANNKRQDANKQTNNKRESGIMKKSQRPAGLQLLTTFGKKDNTANASKGDGGNQFLDLSDLKSIARAREKERSREKSQLRPAPDSDDYDYYASSQPPRTSGLSPSDRPIMIGLTVPYNDSTTPRGTGETVDSASSRTPATPSIVVTPAKESPPWSVHMSNSPEMMFHQPHPRVASSVYSQPSPRLLSDEDIPPVPAIPAFHSIAQQHNTSTEQIFASSTSTDQRPLSTNTEFEVEEKQIEKSGDEGGNSMNDRKRKILHKLSVNTTDANRSPSQGWWTYLLSPLLSRSNTASSRRTAAGLSPEQRGPLSATSHTTLSPPSLPKAIISTEDAASSTSSNSDSTHWWDEKKLSILQEHEQAQPTTREISEKSHFSPDTPEDTNQNTRGISVFRPNFELHGAAAEYYQASAHDLYHPGDPYFECVNHVCSMTSAKKRAEIEASIAAAEKDLQEGREVDEKNGMVIIAAFGYAANEDNPFFAMIETATREAQKEVGFVEDDDKESDDHDGMDKAVAEEGSRDLVSDVSEDEEDEERAMEEPVERGPARSPSPLSSPVLRSLRESPRVPTVRSASPPPVYREPPLPPLPPPASVDQIPLSHDYDREVSPEPAPAPAPPPPPSYMPSPAAPPAYPAQPEHTPMPPPAPAPTYPPEPVNMPMPEPAPAPAPAPRQMPEPEPERRPLPMPMPPSPPAPEKTRELEEQHLDMPEPEMPPPRSEARGPANIPRGYEWEPTPIQIQIHMPYGYGQPKPAMQQHPALLDASSDSDSAAGNGDDRLKDLDEGVRDQPQRVDMPAPPPQTRNDEVRTGRNVLRKQPPPAKTAVPLIDTSVNDMSRDVQGPVRRELEVNEMPPPRNEARGQGIAPSLDWWESEAIQAARTQPRATPLIDTSDDMSRDIQDEVRGEPERFEISQRRNEDRIPRGYEFEPAAARTRTPPRTEAPLIDTSVYDRSRDIQEPARGELERTQISQRRDEASVPRGYEIESRTRSPPRAAAPLVDTSVYDRSRDVQEPVLEELELPPRNEARGRRTSPDNDWWESAPTRTTRSPPRQERTPSPPIPRPTTPPRARSPALDSTSREITSSSRDIKEDSAAAAAATEVMRPAPSFHRPGRFAAPRRNPSPSPPRNRSRSPDELSDTESVLPSYAAAARHRAVSPGLQHAMTSRGEIAMSEVNNHQQTMERHTSVNYFDQPQNLPRPAGNQFVTPADLRSREENETRRRRLENEDNAAEKVGKLWRGRACFPEKGCFGRKKGPEGRKKRRWYCAIILFCMAVIILSVSLATTLTHKNGDSTTTQSEWVNLTDYPPMPTGIMTVAGPAIAKERSSCIAPTQAWSCSLPKGQQQADNAGGYAADQPNFRFEIRYRNESNSTSSTSTTVATSATATATGSNSTSSSTFRRSLYELLSKRDDSTWTASPSAPRLVDQIFIGNTTDNITSPFQGEDTPFYITILSPIDTTNTTNAKVKRDDTSTSTPQSSSPTSTGTSATTAGTATGTTGTSTGTNTATATGTTTGKTSSTSTGTSTAKSTASATDTASSSSTGTGTTTSAGSATSTSSSDFNENSIIPAPDEASDGTAATATLYPTPISQPIKLYNRGLASEHYGFYTYYDKSIFLASDGTVTGDTTDNNSDDTNGGSTEAEAAARCTFSQTRFLVRIWTQPQNVSGMVITASSNSTSANTTSTTTSSTKTASKSAASTSSSANDFISPGSFPYPVSITIDRHGGLATEKLAYCYGIEQESSGTFYNLTDPTLQDENRAAGGTIVNPSPDYLVIAEAIEEGVPEDEIKPVDGGTGGCMCEWRNWEEQITISS